MPRYKYVVRDRAGKKSGTINASSKREAIARLKMKEARVLEIREVPETLLTKEFTIGRSVKLQHFVIFLRQFATLLKAGVTVVDATKILAEQTESNGLKKALNEIEQELREGNPLSSAAGKHKKIFTPMFVNMVRAGEAGGNLDTVLERLADHYEKQHRTKQKIKSALAYPVIVGILAVVVVIFLLLTVVPSFEQTFTDMGAELPAITKFVLTASEFMQAYWWLVFSLLFLLILGIAVFRKNNKTKYYWDYFMLRLPIFGKMFQKSEIARMTRTLSSLFSSSVPILESLSIAEKVVENEVIARVIRDSRKSLERGNSMTAPMEKHWTFPPLVTQMIAIGEQTGSLDAMLNKVADFYEMEVENTTEQIKSLIEPIMIIFLAVLVGLIVMAIYLPMFSIYEQIG